MWTTHVTHDDSLAADPYPPCFWCQEVLVIGEFSVFTIKDLLDMGRGRKVLTRLKAVEIRYALEVLRDLVSEEEDPPPQIHPKEKSSSEQVFLNKFFMPQGGSMNFSKELL